MTDEHALPSAPSVPASPRRRARQCNADYRWTVPKVQDFLRALEQCGRVAEAARAVGMSRQAAYALRARLDGPAFREAFECARRTGLRARAAASRARLEAQVRRGKGRDWRRSITCAPKLLKLTLRAGKQALAGRKLTPPRAMPTRAVRKPTPIATSRQVLRLDG